jgi:hypothetical protein
MSFISRSPSFITEINVLSISSIDLVVVLNIISSRLLTGIVSRKGDVRDARDGVVLPPLLLEVVSKDIPQIGHVGVGSSTAVGSDSDSDCGSGSDCCRNPEQHLRVVYHAAALDYQRLETKKVAVEVDILAVAGYDYIVVAAVEGIAVADVLVADVLVVDVLVVHRKRSLTTLSTTE